MKKLFSIIGLSIILFTSCSEEEALTVETEGKAAITFDAVFGNQDFALNRDFTSGTSIYNFNKFRYWVSNVILINAAGEEYEVPNSYYF
ncbi:MbnP family protein [Pedobacter glucosidilyticus]|uniref:MbnP family protein n=1 Tax=Pedobacter glucosidilyticus TaxID=1122941 RepID=UPI0026F29EDB|nr:MbnP family protein [Pedobacter glucosidilyticus]